jgi:hypothetical protein
MATVFQIPQTDRQDRKARKGSKVDRKALRQLINERYDNTLNYLGR